MNHRPAPPTSTGIDRRPGAEAVVIGAGALLLLLGHVALPDPARFALFLGCLSGATFALLRLQANARAAVVAPAWQPAPSPDVPDIVLEDDLASLEAELHALVDQYRTDCAGASLPR